MQTLARIKELLDLAGHGPKKALGQNFLLDHNLITKLVDASGIRAGSRVLEIGPGTGALTELMLERGARVTAIELDSGLARVLRDTLGERFPGTFTLVEGDCLASKKRLNTDAVSIIGDESFALVANLPYHAATPAMMTLITAHPKCTGMYVTIQKEVVDRLLAPAGSKTYGAIAVAAQCLGTGERIANLPPECFYPRPSVASAMYGWTRDPSIPHDPEAWITHADLTQTLFQSRRKMLGGVVRKLSKSEVAFPEGVTPDDRIDALEPERVWALCSAILGAS